MRISRRAFGTLVGGAVLLAGCGKTPEEAAADRLNWLRGLAGVEKVELVGSADDQYILMTLVKRRSDQDITALIGKIRREFGRREDDYDSRIELDVDNYRARFYLTLPASDLDVDRVLWLRRDGRATGSTYGSSGLLVTAPPAAVAAVAVGLDQVVPSEDARRTHRVETADRQVVVQWTDCPSLDFRLDRAATQHFADLQQRYPGLTGWIEAPDRRAGVYFAAKDIELDALLAALPKLAPARLYGKLELGWGPVRAPETVFAKAFTPQVRRLTAELMKIPGVTRIDMRDDGGPASVTVRDRAGYVAACASLRRIWDSYLSIQLVRRPSPYVGQQGDPVFSGSSFDTGAAYQIYTAVADLQGVTTVQVGQASANLTIAPDITDGDLVTAFKAMAELPIDLYVSHDPDHSLDVAAIGRVAERKYTAPSPTPAEVDPALISRVATAWTRATR
ncbi:hypothetical protein [Kribbella sp. NBC_00359]|uniref:hypothetical protein n=1 Tax=Kribbella sp. NBC_00359 TaxID=2975966 RepID=UPI002E23B351